MSETMTSRERVEKLLNREVPDRVGVTETFWQDTVRSWTAQGYPKGAAPWEVFGHDVVRAGGVTQDAYPGRRSVIAETDAWRTVKDGNGATMRTWKNRPGVPEHIDFEIADADVWRRGYRDAVRTFNPDRVNLDRFTQVRETCRERDLFCCFAGPEVFEIAKRYVGHITMCMAMLEDPEWMADLFDSLAEMQILNWGHVFDNVGLPDAMWTSSDLGFREHPFVSLETYREMILPHDKRLFDFFKSKGLRIILHSCGFIEPLVPGFIEAGIDMLQAMEVKAGVDMRRLKPLYGDRIGFCGNVDIRVLETNALDKVEEEVATKVRCGIEGNGPYIFHTDHSVPSSVRYETYRFAVECALKYGQYA